MNSRIPAHLFRAELIAIGCFLFSAIYSVLFALTKVPGILAGRADIEAVGSIIGTMSVGLAVGLAAAIGTLIVAVSSIVCILLALTGLPAALRIRIFYRRQLLSDPRYHRRRIVWRCVVAVCDFLILIVMNVWTYEFGAPMFPSLMGADVGILLYIGILITERNLLRDLHS